MAISPMDIHNKEFSTVRVGGYNKEEVDAFLDLVAEELDRIIRRYQEQSMMMEELKQKLARFEEMQQTLQNAIINAQRSADQIVEEARIQAQTMIREAQEQKARLATEAQTERERILAAYSGLREQVHVYLTTVRELLEKNLALLSEYEGRLVSREPRETTINPPIFPIEEAMRKRASSPEEITVSEEPSSISEKPTTPVSPVEKEIAHEGPADKPADSVSDQATDIQLEPGFLTPPEKPSPEKEEKEDKHFFWE